MGGAGWWSKTGWDFFYLGGAQICGWGFSIFGHKNIFAGTIFFSLTSFQILKKKHPIFNFPHFSKFQFFSVFQFSWGIFQLSFQFSTLYCLINKVQRFNFREKKTEDAWTTLEAYPIKQCQFVSSAGRSLVQPNRV